MTDVYAGSLDAPAEEKKKLGAAESMSEQSATSSPSGTER